MNSDKKLVKVFNFLYNEKCIIDKAFLLESYKSGRLQDANIFATLLGIKKDIQFKPVSDLDFNEWNINRKQWLLVIIFLKFGVVTKDQNYSREENIEILNQTLHILGGVPSFDDFYKKYIIEKTKKVKIYNPLNPSEDYHKKYNWKASAAFNQDKYKDWDMIQKIGAYFWFRKEKPSHIGCLGNL